jgi:hypothetical protein
MRVWRLHQIVEIAPRGGRFRAGALRCKADMQGGSGSRADRVGTDRGPLVLLLYVRDLVEHLLESVDRRRLLRVERPARMEVRQQYGKRVADAAELLAVGGDVGEHVRLDPGIARLAEIDVDEPEWPPVMNAVNGLIDCTTSPDKGSLNTGMRGSSILSAPRRGHCSGGEDAR